MKRKIRTVKKGEVWLIWDDRSQKERPFVIMSGKLSGIDLDVSGAPTTTQNLRNEFDYLLKDWQEAGLDKPSIVRCSKVHVIYHGKLLMKLGDLSEQDLTAVNQLVKAYFELD